MDGKQVLELMAPVMDSLLEIHKTGLIHRDISPDNMLLTKAGELVLIDFGSARNTNFTALSSKTDTGKISLHQTFCVCDKPAAESAPSDSTWTHRGR